MKKRASRGFTLIELLVVISIIALLAALAIPAIFGAIDKGKMAAEANNIRNLGIGTIGYSNDNGEEIFDPAGSGDTAWPNLLKNRYVPDAKVFLSPFDGRPVTQTSPFPVSFGVNANILKVGDNNSGKFTSPTELILMAPAMTDFDKRKFKTNTSADNATVSPGDGSGATSKKRVTILYADAHVSSLTYAQYKNDSGTDGQPRWTPIVQSPTNP